MAGEFDTLVGTIVGAHGIQGTVRVKAATPTALALITPEKRLSLDDPKPGVAVRVGASGDEGAAREVISAKRQEPKGGILVRFREVSDRSGAEALMGQSVFAPTQNRAPLSEDEYFVEDLIGLRAVTDAGTDLGKVVQVIASPANDVYETDIGAMIPAVKAFIVEIDLPSGQITVRDVPGLKPGEAEEVGAAGGEPE